MLRKLTFMMGAAACGAMVASCGGSSTPTPTPTPTSTPTPSPTPTPTSTATPSTLSFAQDFVASSNGIYIFAHFTPTGGAEVFSAGSRISGSGAVSFTFTPEKVLYAFPTLSETAEFLGADLVTDTPTLRSYTNGTKSLFLELPFQHVMRASYEDTESFISNTVPGDLRSHRVTLLANAITTTDAIDAVLTYTGQAGVVGGTAGTTASGVLTSPAADFVITPSGTTLTVTGSIEVTEDVASVPTQRAVLVFDGTAGTNGSMSGTIEDTANGFTGNFAGTLAGPDREEILLIFSASHTDGRRYLGSYIAQK